ncbi:MAG: MFS transporter [Opitutaceae bacterium]|nr:MFS transporter [Opitutaceae bacterium]
MRSELAPASSNPIAKSTRVRYKVAGLTFLLAMITYLDRVCIATLAPSIMAEFSITKVQMGYVFSAFALAYAAFEIPTARFADQIGTRAVLTRIVVWWSAFTIATGAAFNYASFLAARFLFGAGEAGAWPCAARVFARWIPRRERGTLQGLFFSAAFLSGAITPLMVTFLLQHLSWRLVFVVFGLFGLAWAAVWHWWFRSEPAEHPEVNQAELELIASDCGAATSHAGGARFWRQVLLNPNVLALCLMYFPNSFVFYFCITWLPTYLKERHNFTTLSLDFFTGLPLLLSAFGVVLGGLTMDRLIARYGDRIGRCGLGAAAYSVAALALLIAPSCADPITAAVLIAVAMAANTFTLSAAWGTCIEIGGSNAGVVSATMNTAGQIGSLLCPLIVAYTLKWFNNWDISIYIMSALFFVGVACWCIIDPRRQLLADSSPNDP